MKKINIPIHKHTPVRRKRSVWIIDGLYHFGGYSCNGQNIPLVTDLKRVPKSDVFIKVWVERLKYALPTDYMGIKFEAGVYGKPKKLGFWRNLWQNKIKKLRRK